MSACLSPVLTEQTMEKLYAHGQSVVEAQVGAVPLLSLFLPGFGQAVRLSLSEPNPRMDLML
jgi:hypothetical protein